MDASKPPEPFTITNDEGRTFLVRFVFTGDRYGLNDCLVHNEPGAMVEFYDHTPAIVESFRKAGQGDRGQFVSRYAVETLATSRNAPHGLNLHGGVPEWQVDGAALAPVVALCRDLIR